jgi:hypothetical protein
MLHLWRTEAERKREEALNELVETGQEAIRSAVSSTTEAANHLLKSLRNMDVMHVVSIADFINQIEKPVERQKIKT